MSTYEELWEDFNRKVEELRKNCPHPKISDWMPYEWAPGHYSHLVKVCEVCNAIVSENRDREALKEKLFAWSKNTKELQHIEELLKEKIPNV